MNDPKSPPSKHLRIVLRLSGGLAWLNAKIEDDPSAFVAPLLGSVEVTKDFSVVLESEGYDNGPILAVKGADLPMPVDVLSSLLRKIDKHIHRKLAPICPAVRLYGEWSP